MWKFWLFLVLLNIGGLGCSSVPPNRSYQSEERSTCAFAEMADFYRREILFNIFHEFVMQLHSDYGADGFANPVKLKRIYADSLALAQQNCGPVSGLQFYLKKDPFEVLKVRENGLQFNSFERFYDIERARQGSYVSYGIKHRMKNSPDAPLALVFEMIFDRDQLVSVRTRGRANGSGGEFFIATYEPSLRVREVVKDAAQNESPLAIRSLRAIYGGDVDFQKSEMIVGVMGSGVDYNHPELADKILLRRDLEASLIQHEALKTKLFTHPYLSEDELADDLELYERQSKKGFPAWLDQMRHTPFPFDEVYPPRRDFRFHETMVASRIVRGTEGVHFIPVRMAYDPNNDFSGIVNRLVALGAKIINMSFGYSFEGEDINQTSWREIFRKHSGVLFVVSAGNQGYNIDEQKISPALYGREFNNVVVVASLGVNRELSKYEEGGSNYGPLTTTIAVQGDHLEVAVPQSTFARKEPRGGTSIATAEITNLALRYFKNNPRLRPEDFKNYLIECAIKLGSLGDKVQAQGYVTIDQSLSCSRK